MGHKSEDMWEQRREWGAKCGGGICLLLLDDYTLMNRRFRFINLWLFRSHLFSVRDPFLRGGGWEFKGLALASQRCVSVLPFPFSHSSAAPWNICFFLLGAHDIHEECPPGYGIGRHFSVFFSSDEMTKEYQRTQQEKFGRTRGNGLFVCLLFIATFIINLAPPAYWVTGNDERIPIYYLPTSPGKWEERGSIKLNHVLLEAAASVSKAA